MWIVSAACCKHNLSKMYLKTIRSHIQHARNNITWCDYLEYHSFVPDFLLNAELGGEVEERIASQPEVHFLIFSREIPLKRRPSCRWRVAWKMISNNSVKLGQSERSESPLNRTDSSQFSYKTSQSGPQQKTPKKSIPPLTACFSACLRLQPISVLSICASRRLMTLNLAAKKDLVKIRRHCAVRPSPDLSVRWLCMCVCVFVCTVIAK